MNEPPRGVRLVRSTTSVPQNDPAWLDVFRAVDEEGGALVAIEAGVVVGWLLFAKRDSPLGVVYSSTPYLAYGGPVASGDDREVMCALIAAYRQLAIDSGAAAVTLGTPPFLSEETTELWRRSFAPTFTFENTLQISALDRHPLEALPKKLREPKLRQIRGAIAAGYTVGRIEDASRFEQWLSLYLERYAEIGAQPYPVEFFRSLFEKILLSGKAELWAAFLGDELIGGTLLLVDGATADYFSSAYSSEHRSHAPQQMVLAEAFTDLMRRGVQRLNWESSPSRNGVHTFKARWGATESRHFYHSLLLDETLLLRTAGEIRSAFPLRFVVPFSSLRAGHAPPSG